MSSSTYYRSRTRKQGMMGASAPVYADEDESLPYIPIRRTLQYGPPPRRANARVIEVRTLTLLVSIGLLAAVLCGVSLNKQAKASAAEKQIDYVQGQILTAQRENEDLTRQIALYTDGEQIRAFAVNKLHMKPIQSSQVRVVSMPDTRPLSQIETPVQATSAEEGGLMNMLAGLLRWIRI